MNKRVLIVDDDDDFVNLSVNSIADKNIAIDTVSNAVDALIKLKENRYSCVLLDIFLGHSHTSEKVVEEVRHNEAALNYQTPLIVFSAKMNEEFAQKIRTRTSGSFCKPLARGVLNEAVNKAVLEAETLSSGKLHGSVQILERIDQNLGKVLLKNDRDSLDYLIDNLDKLVGNSGENGEDKNKEEKFSATALISKKKKDKSKISHKNKTGEIKTILKGLLQAKKIDVQDINGRTALMLAAALGDVELCRDLISKGADANILSKDGRNAIHYAASSGSIEVLNVLLKAGTRVRSKDYRRRDGLYYAVKYGKIEMVLALIDHGLDLHARTEGMNYLMMAALQNNAELCECLLNKGIDSRITDPKGRTAFHYALAKRHQEVLKLFKTKGLFLDDLTQTSIQ